MNRVRSIIAAWELVTTTAAARTVVVVLALAAGAVHARPHAPTARFGKPTRPLPGLSSALFVLLQPDGNSPAPTTTPETGETARPVATPEIGETETVQELASVLADPSQPQPQRDDAARRLAARLGVDDPNASRDARQALLTTLTDQNVGGQLAVARALAQLPPIPPGAPDGFTGPDAAFINPLFAAFGANDRLNEAAARALSNYRDSAEVLTRLIRIATDARARGAVERTRAAVLRAIGAFPEKRAAGELVALVRKNDESVVIRHAAADALVAMTGLSEFAQDAQQWERWWLTNQPKADVDFRHDMLARKAHELERVQGRLAQVAAELQNKAAELYQLTPAGQKPAMLDRELRSAEPELRVWAAHQVSDDFVGGRGAPSQGVRDRLREMIADPVPQVRAAAIRSIGLINDRDSLDAILEQADRENNTAVRMAIADALRGMGDARAGETLLRLLDDPSRAVARSAAVALRELGPRLVEQNPALVQRVATALREVIERPTLTPSDVELREAAAEALVPLKQRDLIPTLFPRLLRPSESTRVRRAALRALGEIGDPNTADTIVATIGDPDAGVSLEAVRALKRVRPTPAQLEALRPILTEPRRDPSIRDEAWTVLQAALPDLTRDQLNLWASRFRDDPQRAIIVYQRLLQQLIAEKATDEAAVVQQQIADSYMALAPPDPESAIPFYRAALEYRLTNRTGGPVVAQLIDSLMKALLRSGKYPDAIAFAAEQLRRDSGVQHTMGPAIRNEVESLSRSDRSEELRRANELIDLAVQMQPALAEQYLDALRALKKTVQAKLG